MVSLQNSDPAAIWVHCGDLHCHAAYLASWLKMWNLYWIWLLVMNIAAFMLFRHDKRLAQQSGARRISESSLLTLMLVGGFVGGGLGMMIRPRHKTRKPVFWLVLVAACVLHALLIVWWRGL